MLERLRAAWQAFWKKPEPLNGGHRYSIQSGNDAYAWADAYRIDPYSGEVIWICDKGDHVELKTKLPGWGILVDFEPGVSVEEFRNIETIEKTVSI